MKIKVYRSVGWRRRRGWPLMVGGLLGNSSTSRHQGWSRRTSRRQGWRAFIMNKDKAGGRLRLCSAGTGHSIWCCHRIGPWNLAKHGRNNSFILYTMRLLEMISRDRLISGCIGQTAPGPNGTSISRVGHWSGADIVVGSPPGNVRYCPTD